MSNVTRDELRDTGFDVSAATHRSLAGFVKLLLDENRNLNLTATRTSAEAWRLHVCDSLALASVVGSASGLRVLDLGSGGGVPGIPLACACPDVDVTLVDATRKKVDAAGRIIAALELSNARAVWGRAETLGHDPAWRERFDVVTARAVAALPTLLELAAGFLRVGGVGWFFKSATAGEEIEQARKAAQACQLEPAGERSYRLPGETDERVLVGYRKVAELTPDLPRPTGRPKKRPL